MHFNWENAAATACVVAMGAGVFGSLYYFTDGDRPKTAVAFMLLSALGLIVFGGLMPEEKPCLCKWVEVSDGK